MDVLLGVVPVFGGLGQSLALDDELARRTRLGKVVDVGPIEVWDLVLTRGRPTERVLTTPPVLCIEILSSEDRIARINTRIQDYFEFGVPVVWLVDPEERRLWIYRPGVPFEEAIGSVKLDGTSIEVPFSEIFD